MSIILITGGARSGKSALAETLAEQQGAGVFYIATSVITDEDMAERVRHHRATRPAHWRTHEGYRDMGAVLAGHQIATESVILECITTWVTNLLFDFAGETPPDAMDFAELERQIALQVDALLVGCHQCAAPVYLVTNEVGMGIVPENRLARHFRDIAGRINQRLAAEAEDVYLVVSGIGVKIK